MHRLESDLPTLTDPVLVCALDGWVDAAGAASAAAEHLTADGRLVARFDGDELFDYRSRRPVLDVVDGVLSSLEWPELTLEHIVAGGRDLLVLAGAEPDLRWEALAGDVVALAQRLGVVEWVSLGAVPGAVPHTRPTPVMVTASAEGLLRHGEVPGPAGVLRVPAAALSVLEMAASDAGLPAVGYFAQVPPYAGTGYAAATVVLLEHLGRHLEVPFDLEPLRATAASEIRRFDMAVANDPETRQVVTQLEEAAGEADMPLPTGDELASELERFLREHAGDEPEGPGLGGGTDPR
jgi:hypothetical protein